MFIVKWLIIAAAVIAVVPAAFATESIVVDGVTYRPAVANSIDLLPGQVVVIGKSCEEPVRVSFFKEEVTCSWTERVTNAGGLIKKEGGDVETKIQPRVAAILPLLSAASSVVAMVLMAVAMVLTVVVVRVALRVVSSIFVMTAFLSIFVAMVFFSPSFPFAGISIAALVAAIVGLGGKREWFLPSTAAHLVLAGVAALMA